MNQDSAAMTSRLLAVADGMGGHAHGEVASTVAVTALLDLDARLRTVGSGQVDLLAVLGEAVGDAADRLTVLARDNPDLRGTGTTVVALLVDGSRIGVVHIGDSRAYRLRAGELERLTHDHTLVQTLVDEGQLTPEAAAVHPRRSWLVRTLQESTPAEPDLFLLDGQPGDRYLVCSDGVTAVLDDVTIGEVLGAVSDPDEAVARLIELANEGGGPDNITCVVADIVDEAAPSDDEAAEDAPHEDTPVVVGAAAQES